MSNRYQVVQRPHVELFSLKPGESPHSKAIDALCYQVEDSMTDGDYVGGPYKTEEEAQSACDKLNQQ